jgi:hypothetical protein
VKRIASPELLHRTGDPGEESFDCTVHVNPATRTVTRTATVVQRTSTSTTNFGFARSDEVEFVSACLDEKNVTQLGDGTKTQVCGCAMQAIEAQSSPTEFAQLVADWRSAATGTGRLAPDLAIATCLHADQAAATSSSTTSATSTTTSRTSNGSTGFVSCSAPGLAEGHLAVPFTASGVGCAEGSRLLRRSSDRSIRHATSSQAIHLRRRATFPLIRIQQEARRSGARRRSRAAVRSLGTRPLPCPRQIVPSSTNVTLPVLGRASNPVQRASF